ncbi:MAG: copper resistance system multicopper oxidase [Candidatus Thiodiazotropha sp.]
MSRQNDLLLQEGLYLTRRRFVKGLSLAGAAAMGLHPAGLLAGTGKAEAVPTLRGREFNLSLSRTAVNFTGSAAVATTVNGSLPAPTLRWREGDRITLNVTNLLPETSSIHWHGIILPSAMDGVPGISTGFDGIPPGETFRYQFDLKQSGTYWYHSHSGFQEQTGLYGAIVIDPMEPEPFSYDRDYVVVLSDWTDEDPNAVYAKLKKLSHYYNLNERTHADLMRDLERKGLSATWNERKMWGQMRMSQRDLSDVTASTYTYLMNGTSPAEGWIGPFKPKEKILLRIVNASAMTFFDLRIPGLKMTVVAADGQYVEPVTVEEIRLGVAETYDVLVEPAADTAYTLFAQDIARSGYARGTLTPHPSMTAPVPALDKVADLGHADMGMSMHHHMGHGMSAADHSHHEMSAPMDHSQHQMTDGMDHSQHQMTGGMDHSQHTMPTHGGKPQPDPSDFSSGPVKHAPTEYGPHVDMLSEDPQYRLDDPGVGLRNNGRRVLTYADLRSLHSTREDPDPDREIELHLTGNMGRYMWSINGVKHADAEPLRWRLGERLRINFVNDTMMNHPMHLHGMWSDLESGDNNHLPRKHTVIVQPGSRISYRVNVDAEGGWAYHCHLLYHMLGMFRTVIVS